MHLEPEHRVEAGDDVVVEQVSLRSSSHDANPSRAAFPREQTATVVSAVPACSDGCVKKLINNPPADVVGEALLGLAAAHGDRLRVDHDNRVVFRKDAPPVSGKVGLVSGGGSGHEPMHGGFVGLGMLDAACAGEVFTSPPVPDQIIAATRGVDGGAGVLHIVKNYTGDVMNFEMAAEMVSAETGIDVVAVITDETWPCRTACSRRAGVGSE